MSGTFPLEINSENTICIHTPKQTLVHAELTLKEIAEGIFSLMAHSVDKP